MQFFLLHAGIFDPPPVLPVDCFKSCCCFKVLGGPADKKMLEGVGWEGGERGKSRLGIDCLFWLPEMRFQKVGVPDALCDVMIPVRKQSLAWKRPHFYFAEKTFP